MNVAKILWVDDEIDSLNSQIMFLENKGYEVQTRTNGFDAVEFVKENVVDVVLMDETMPGITGLQTLQQMLFLMPGTSEMEHNLLLKTQRILILTMECTTCS